MRAIFLLLTLLLLTSGYAMDPPGIIWVRNYFTNGRAYFLSISETEDNGFIVAGFKHTGPGATPDSCLFRFNSSGDLLWSVGVDGYTWDIAYWVEELPDGTFISTGATREAVSTSKGVFIQKVDSSGNQLWVKFYDDPTVTDQGNCVLPLEDGFAVAGNTGLDVWVIRTDLQGDSLWSAVYEGPSGLSARRVLQVDDTLVVFAVGPFLRILGFDSSNGQLLWVVDDLPSFLGSVYLDGGDMILSTTDNGFTFVNHYHPYIVHTDSIGNVLWYFEIPYDTRPLGRSISNTMDGGYIYGGVNTYLEPEAANSAWSGMVFKYDSEGQIQWGDFVYECYDLFCIRQLSQGGYIACGRGNEGTLVRYAPETGIAEPDPASALSLEVSPNPCSSFLSVSFCLVEMGNASVSIFDLSGKLISLLADGVYPAGSSSVDWQVPDEVSTGCYMIRCCTESESITQSIVVLR